MACTDHYFGDFWRFLYEAEQRGWIVRSTSVDAEMVICDTCWENEHGPRTPSRYERSPEPMGDRTENIGTMSMRRCGQIARALGFEIYVVRNLSADEDGGVWGIMLRTPDGGWMEMSLNSLIEHFPHEKSVTFKVQRALSSAAEEVGGAYVTYDDPKDSDAKNIIVFPFGTPVLPKE